MQRRRHRPRQSLTGRAIRAAARLAVVVVGVSVAGVLVLRFVDPPFSAVMLLEPGPLGDIDYRPVNRAAMPALAAQAVIAAEDQRFLTHHGIDFDALNDAIADFRDGDDLRGASTITQQVAKNLLLWNGRSVIRKGLEACLALLIDATWPKQRILEVYLNIAEFGTGVFGIEAAAMRFYGVPAARLSAAQAATLAGVLPSPKRLDARNPGEYLRDRQRAILEQMRLLEERGHYAGLEW
jgi:monofunctional biosynthetic peptidoglycan transglycosylase